MLPIARRRTLAVPHGLAALAAAVCLTLAFATDHSDVQQQFRAEQSEPSAVQHLAGDGRRSDNTVPAGEKPDSRDRDAGIDLLPWFAGLGGRGG